MADATLDPGGGIWFPPGPPDRNKDAEVRPFGSLKIPSLLYVPGTQRMRFGPFTGEPGQEEPMRPDHWRWNTERGAQRPSAGGPESVGYRRRSRRNKRKARSRSA